MDFVAQFIYVSVSSNTLRRIVKIQPKYIKLSNVIPPSADSLPKTATYQTNTHRLTPTF